MSPNVVFASQYVPFDAADYTWVDMKDIPNLDIEVRRQMLRDRGVDPDNRNFSGEIKLPFEKFALILPPFDFDLANTGNVLTIHRKKDKFTMYGWRTGFPDCLFTFKIVPHPDPELGKDQEYVYITNHKKIPIAKQSDSVIDHVYKGVMQTFVSYITCFCAGVYGKEREVYRCTGDATVNAKRRKKNKKPMYDWHTVVVQTTRTQSSGKSTGTHAPHRQHEVRGHYVKSKLGKVFWRKSHKRGDASLGVIFHDYVTKESANVESKVE